MRISLKRAIGLLRKGAICAIPTETVYGLAARIDRPEAIERIFVCKGRPRANPLIVHLADLRQLFPFVAPHFAHIEVVKCLAGHFWPGPMTLALPVKSESVHPQICAGLPTVCFRIPDHPLAIELLRKSGPLVAPSANPSGRPSATSCCHVETDFGRAFPVLDGGQCLRGIESTILGWQGEHMQQFRPGSLSLERVREALNGGTIEDGGHEAPCPGSRFPHYAPRARLFTEIERVAPPRAVIGFSDRSYPDCARFFSLGLSENDREVARRLFATLRHVDDCRVSAAFVDIDLPSGGLWPAIRERLERAARGESIVCSAQELPLSANGGE